MNQNKVKTYLGFAIRSGKVIFGFDNLISSKKKPKLVLVSSTQNEKVTNKIESYCSKSQISFIKLESPLEELVSRENCKVISILDDSLSVAIKNEFQMEN